MNLVNWLQQFFSRVALFFMPVAIWGPALFAQSIGTSQTSPDGAPIRLG